MRFTNMFIPTLREVPSEAEAVSHKLLLRAGYVRILASGLYMYLPLGLRVIQKITTIIREEMNALGGLEITLSALQPAEIWQQSGRWNNIGDEMFRLKDRSNRDMCLGMTHEEVITWLVSKEIRSYRELPLILYQIQTKFRDEARPKSGILRTREFIMKDSYSFDTDEKGLEKSYNLHLEAYKKIFSRCGLRFYTVESDPGMMGGFTAHEFMAPSPAGEDEIVICHNCGYAANVEIAVTKTQKIEDKDWPLEEVLTEGKRTVDEVASFLNLPSAYFIKSLLMMSEAGPVLVLVRGDRELHEKKLHKIVGYCRPAQRDEVRNILGVQAGYIGPMNHKVKILADLSLQKGSYVSGANKENYHVKGIRAGVHFDAQWHDLQKSSAGDPCSRCGSSVYEEKAIEIGNIFRLGTKYSVPLKALYLDKEGKEKPIVMGSYGIGPARIAASAIEQNHDEKGLKWPPSIAPFDVQILPLKMKDQKSRDISGQIYDNLQKQGIEVLIDDRDERPGVKFNDADLIGIPWHIIVGEKGIAKGVVEIRSRFSGESELVPLEKVTEVFREKYLT
jgi:prolyl-tRNA synthetase